MRLYEISGEIVKFLDIKTSAETKKKLCAGVVEYHLESILHKTNVGPNGKLCCILYNL